MTSDQPDIDKILDHNRQQLSALMDGALSPDEARFLLRRLQHDEALAQCWSRWQLCGDILRGQVHAPAPAGFARRVAAAVAQDATTQQPGTQQPGTLQTRARKRAWGVSGVALAASVAMLALFVTRQSPDVTQPTDPQPAQVAASQTPAVSTNPSLVAAAEPSGQAPDLPNAATGLAAIEVVAELPRRATLNRSRGQSQRAASQRAAIRATRGNTEPQTALAAAAPKVGSEIAAAASSFVDATVDPFTRPQAKAIPARPWPRALLPESASSGAFNVDYAHQDTAAPQFYPFQPQPVPLAVPTQPQVPQAGRGNEDRTQP